MVKNMSRSQSIEYIESLIEDIDKRIVELGKHQDALQTALEFVREGKPTSIAPTEPSHVWYVQSRSGGNPHYVGYNDYSKVWDCTCEAQKSFKQCWALRGVREKTLHRRDWESTFNFTDPKYYETHTAQWLAKK